MTASKPLFESIDEVRQTMLRLESMGLIRRTGRYRRNPETGENSEVCELTELGKKTGPKFFHDKDPSNAPH
jgi:hypothetical protein